MSLPSTHSIDIFISNFDARERARKLNSIGSQKFEPALRMFKLVQHGVNKQTIQNR
jgi:hypothetical protein